uniref:Uncharacterized protein n=1 Tax=Anguilla anguilla TaxID=7936 RepID=A0A0E9WBD6_ANGAN
MMEHFAASLKIVIKIGTLLAPLSSLYVVQCNNYTVWQGCFNSFISVRLKSHCCQIL